MQLLKQLGSAVALALVILGDDEPLGLALEFLGDELLHLERDLRLAHLLILEVDILDFGEQETVEFLLHFGELLEV